MTTGTDNLLPILQNHYNPREEGWLWLAFSADDAGRGVVNQIEGRYDDSMVAARGLARLIDAGSPDRVYLALCRGEARPTEADREMWRELRRLVGAPPLTDMVVFNEQQAWSMSLEDHLPH